MLKGRRRLAIVLAAVGICAIVFSGAALAAGSLAPQLRAPRQGKAVPKSHVKLTVYVPDPSNIIEPGGKVFLTVSDKRIVKKGVLQIPKHCGFHCNIGEFKRVKGSAHLYSYVDPYHFPGNWQDTPGKYYWQAFYYPKGVVGILPSKIGSFRIVG
jgi:hypothetical protein